MVKKTKNTPPGPNPKLRAGIGVTIQRSNGRTHAATIMQVNDAEQNCQVEWEEEKEIKAKQISLEAIYRLNVHLQPGVVDNSNENSAVPSPSSGVDSKTSKSSGNSSGETKKPVKSKLSNDNGEGSQLANKNNQKLLVNGDDTVDKNTATPLKPWQQKKNVASLGNQKKDDKNIPINEKSSSDEMDTASPPEPVAKIPAPKRKLRNQVLTKPEPVNRPASRAISRPTSVNDNRVNNTRAKTPGLSERPESRIPAKPIRTKTPGHIERNRPSSGHGIKSSIPGLKKVSNGSNLVTNPAANPAANQAANQASSQAANQASNQAVNAASNQTENQNKDVKNSRQSLVVGNIAKIEEKRHRMRMEHAQQRQNAKQRRQKYQHNSNWQHAEFVDEYRQSVELNPLKKGESMPITDRRITVAVRKRPINNKELDRCEVDCCSVVTKDKVVVHEPKQKVDLTKYLDNQEFRFDCIFNQDSDNELVYRYTAAPLVKSVCQGGMATCFAYGQTGTGKTHTMGGEFKGKNQSVDGGLYYFCARDLFLRLRRDIEQYNPLGGAETGQFYVACSFFEIYSGRVYDLMNERDRLRVLEDKKGNINVVGLREIKVQNVQDVLSILQEGSSTRTSGKNAVNNTSSRSHAIFQLKIKTELNINNKQNPLFGQFSLVDLAGNERGSETANDRRVRAEGAEINKSLLALKECIRAMATNQKHLPFRGSMLTKVLRSSFLGKKSKTCMIAMISPCADSCEQTLNTLRYADRVKELPVEGNTNNIGAANVEMEDDSFGVIDVNELSADGNIREEIVYGSNSRNVDEHVSVESTLSGINLLGPSDEFKRLQQEEQDALKAADEVQMAEEAWIQELEGLMDICSKLQLLHEQSSSADINRDVMKNDAKFLTTDIQTQLKHFVEMNNMYGEALQSEEDASQRLEQVRDALDNKKS